LEDPRQRLEIQILGQVAGGARTDDLERLFVVGRRREHHDPARGLRLQHHVDGLQRIGAGQPIADQHHVGVVEARELDGLVAARRLGDHGKDLAVQRPGEHLARQGVAVRDDDPHSI
jgi:hypothetical protein